MENRNGPIVMIGPPPRSKTQFMFYFLEKNPQFKRFIFPGTDEKEKEELRKFHEKLLSRYGPKFKK